MIKNWLIYIITVAGLAIFAIMYIKQSGFIVFMMALLVPVIYSVIVYFIGKKKLKVYMKQELTSAARNENVGIQVVIENTSGINKGSKVVIWLLVKNGLGTNICRIKKKVYLVSGQEVVQFDYIPKYSGINEIVVDKVRVYNGFSLICSSPRVKERLSFLVMPEYKEYPIELQTLYEENEGESDRFSHTKAGNDPSELYAIRNYRSGDKLNRINWKFSAKNNTLMVQDYGFSIACDTAVFIDVANEKDMDKIEQAVEILYYIVLRFIMAEKMFYVIWKDNSEEKAKRKKMSSEQDIYDLFGELFRSGMGKYTSHLEDVYSAQYEGELLAGSIFVYTGRDELEEEIVRLKLRTDRLEFVHV